MTAGMVHVTNLTPGSECNPSQRSNDFNLTDGDDYGDNNDTVYKAAMETASAVIRLVDPSGWEGFIV
jgi:hypothetical protein